LPCLPGVTGGWLTYSLSVSHADHGQAQPPLHRCCKHSPRFMSNFAAQRHILHQWSAPPPRLSLSAPGSPIQNIFPPLGVRVTPPLGVRLSHASLHLRALCPPATRTALLCRSAELFVHRSDVHVRRLHLPSFNRVPSSGGGALPTSPLKSVALPRESQLGLERRKALKSARVYRGVLAVLDLGSAQEVCGPQSVSFLDCFLGAHEQAVERSEV